MITLTNHHRFTGEHVANALERFFRITLLDMSDQRINHRHAQNHQGIYPVAHDRRQQRRRQQDVNQHIIKMRQKAQPRRLPGLLRQRIFTILRKRADASAPLMPSGVLLVLVSVSSTES